MLKAHHIRHQTIALSCKTGAGHLAPSLSCVEILTVLFRDFLQYKAGEPVWDGRDRLIFSKGHGAYAYYVILNALGFIPDWELEHFYGERATIKGCLTRNPDYMIEASTGSLGHGLPIAMGIAKALKMQGMTNRVVCIVGDGEMQEGSNFEALNLAVRFGLDNLLLIIDANDLQAMSPVAEVGLSNAHLARVMRAYTEHFTECDGHDEEALRGALAPFFANHPTGAPHIVMAHTVKGKGVALMEGSVAHHFRCPTQDGYVLLEDEA